jgi:hypothetical protein
MQKLIEAVRNSRHWSHEFLLSRLAREVKVVPAKSREAISRAANSAGLLAWRPLAHGLPIRLALTTWPNSGSRAVGAALQSRGGDGFAPSSRTRSSRVNVDGLHAKESA